MRFFSDNAAAACPEVLAAMHAANRLDTAYDGDAWSQRLSGAFSALFGTQVEALWVATGTAANSLALAALCPSHGSIVCHRDAHIQNDECGAPEFYTGGSKLLIGDMELRATEAVSGQGTRQSDSKFFHMYQNGACYEFALNVTTDASEEGLVKHVDRDKVFNRLEQILATVKINPVAPEVTAEAPTPSAPSTPAQ